MNRPNVLLITSDQRHANTIGALNPEIRTPALDRLVEEGTTFSRAYCPNPTCTPTRGVDHHRQVPEPARRLDARHQVAGVHGLRSHVRSEDDRRQLVATYYGMVSMLDKYVGTILDRLDQLDMADDTIVIFTTDHGHFFGQHGLQAKGPFHYEDLLRVPLLVRWPGRVPAGRMSPALQSLVDLSPTLLSMVGIDMPPDMTGVDQTSVWLGAATSARDHVLCEFHHEPTTVHLRTYIDERCKVTVYQDQSYGELFDLQDDPGETHNRWSDPDYAELKSDLLLRLIWADLGRVSMPMPRIASA